MYRKKKLKFYLGLRYKMEESTKKIIIYLHYAVIICNLSPPEGITKMGECVHFLKFKNLTSTKPVISER